MSQPASLSVQVDGLRLRYGDVTALEDICFTLEPGKLYGLLGRNGSGKTSLLSVLAAFRRATAGTVLIDGQPVFENPSVTRRVCLIRESGDLGDGGDRIADAIAMVRYLRPSWDAEYAADLLDRFGISTSRKLGELSRGQRSALGCTVGLASRAPLTIFDESHLGMDAPTRQAFNDELLADFMAHPRTIVVSTHLIDEVGPLAERVLILDEGRLVLHEDTESLRSHGAAVTGPAEAVDRFVGGLTVLHERRLGPTKSVAVYGAIGDDQRRLAREAGLELEPLALQDLFGHLTQSPGGTR